MKIRFKYKALEYRPGVFVTQRKKGANITGDGYAYKIHEVIENISGKITFSIWNGQQEVKNAVFNSKECRIVLCDEPGLQYIN